MGARRQKPGVTRLGRFMRGRRFDRNPLRRATDRVETVVLAVVVIALLLGAPLAAVVTGSWMHAMAQRTQFAQEASRHQVDAVVLSVTPPSPDDQAPAWQAQVRWKTPGGREVTNEIPVPFDMAVGGTLLVWTDRSGGFTTAPLLNSQVAGQTACGEVLGVIGVVVVLAVASATAIAWLNKRRMATWDADWQATEPRWTTRT